jgi:hypothetical protein
VGYINKLVFPHAPSPIMTSFFLNTGSDSIFVFVQRVGRMFGSFGLVDAPSRYREVGLTRVLFCIKGSINGL